MKNGLWNEVIKGIAKHGFMEWRDHVFTAIYLVTAAPIENYITSWIANGHHYLNGRGNTVSIFYFRFKFV